MMKPKPGLTRFFTGLTVAFALSLPGTAQAFDLSFSFENFVENGGGTVTGVIRGLNEGTGPATSVEVLTNTAGFGIGEYVGNPFTNTWAVVNGELTTFEFSSFGVSNSPRM